MDKSSAVCDKSATDLLMRQLSSTSPSTPPPAPLRRLLARIFCRIAAASDTLAQRLDQSGEPRLKLLVRYWHAIAGDHTLRLDYHLDESAIVLDVGGYEGEWTNNIHSRYPCRIHVFEPVSQFAESIRQRFAGMTRISIHEFGLGGRTRRERISVQGWGSSIYKEDPRAIGVQIVRVGDFLAEHKVDRVALMKINIEGGEYELLEHMLADGLSTRVENFQIQFHEFFPDAAQRMRELQERLRRTHDLTYQYPFVWENWRLRKG